MAAGMAAVLLYPMDTQRYLQVDASRGILDRRGEPLMSFLNSGEQWCFPLPLAEVSPYLVQATLAVEDRRFHMHPGVDPVAVARAAGQNLRYGDVVSGASTLTMQVVKRKQSSSRSLPGKVVQAMQALRLDARVPKDRILETYLNTAPYGMNLVGCEAAARRYFGVPARELTLAQGALLAGLPKAPSRYMPLKHPEAARRRRDFVLKRMREERFIGGEDLRRAVAEPLGAAWHDYPALSPHLAFRLDRAASHRDDIATTLDGRLQRRVESFVAERLRHYGGSIHNAAVLVIDVENAEILARVGSGDFFGLEEGGGIDACRSLRSPGSTLKPMVYGYAIESDLLYPCETLYDNTLDYGMYTPQNFDGQFNGLVSAQEALRLSLNIPAITVLSRVGVGRAIDFLREMEIDTLARAPDHYGLGLLLGNCEARLEDLAAAYCAIANLGEYRPLRVVAGRDREDARRCLSRGTCLALYNMLEQPLPGEFAGGLVPSGDAPSRVAWKTGTSAGNRDAWSFVFNQHYVVAVWMGNSSGAPSKWLVGADAALPLAARIFRSLPAKAAPAWPEMAIEMKSATVCAASGLPRTQWCPATREELLPRLQYLLRRCTLHSPAPDEPEAAIVTRWPVSAMQWDLASIEAPNSTPSSAAAQPTQGQEQLRIVQPANRAAFVLTGEANADRIALQATSSRDADRYWYLDDIFLGIERPGDPLLIDLEPGAHRVTCMSPSGQVDSADFTVTLPGGLYPENTQ